MNEPCFFDDLQNFCKFFISEKDKIRADKVSQIDTFTDKYRLEHPVYFTFDFQIPQRATVLSNISGFKNIEAEKATVRPSFDEGRNLWILKPSWMSRGRGLELFSTLEQLNGFLKMYVNGYDAKDFKEMEYSDKSSHSPSLNVASRKRERGSSSNCKPF